MKPISKATITTTYEKETPNKHDTKVKKSIIMVESSVCTIECSDQPLDISYHPKRSTIIAAALVDGTIEVHDYEELLQYQQQQQQQQTVGSTGRLKTDDNNDNSDIDDNDDNDDDEIDTILSSTKVHTQLIPSKINTEIGYKHASCRAVLFGTGTTTEHLLYTGGSAGDIKALDTERLCTFSSKKNDTSTTTKWFVPQASKSPIHVLYEYKDNNNNDTSSTTNNNHTSLIVSGDDTGGIRLWDSRLLEQYDAESKSTTTSTSTRTSTNPIGCVLSWKKHTDYISCITQSQYDTDNNLLIASSADGCISIYDIRMASTLTSVNSTVQEKDKYVTVTDCMDDELLSLCCIKSGQRIVCGTTDGILNIWNYNKWDNVSHRYTGLQAYGIDTICKLNKQNENMILCGCSDGIIRVVSIEPNKLLGIFGDTYCHNNYPIEKLICNFNTTNIASITHDNNIRIFDTNGLIDDTNDIKDDTNAQEQRMRQVLTEPVQMQQQQPQQNRDSDDEWDDMDDNNDNDSDMENDNDDNNNNNDVAMNSDDDDDDDSDDDDSSSEDNNNKGKNNKKNNKKSNILKTEQERFFDDL